MSGKKSINREIWNYLGNIILIGSIPIVLFWVAIGLSFLFYPYDMDGAGNLLMVFSGAGCLISIFLIVLNIRRIINRVS